MFVPDPEKIVSTLPRRQFFAAGAAVGAGLSLARLAGAQAPATGEERSILTTSAQADPQPLPEPAAKEKPSEPIITPGARVLFQGDSITDAGRNRATDLTSQYQGWGTGYAFLAASEMMMANPDYALQIYNRGISGNKVPQLAERWQADCLDLKPDVLSILVGVNDLWHRFTGGYTGTPESYYEHYRELIQRTKTELPNVKLVIGEPFVLKVGAVDDKFFPAIHEYQDAAEAIAIEFADAWVPYQKVFDAASRVAPPSVWLPDGVHPSAPGAAVMAHAWLSATAGCVPAGTQSGPMTSEVRKVAEPAQYQQPPAPTPAPEPAPSQSTRRNDRQPEEEQPGTRLDRIRSLIRRRLR